MFIQIWLTVAPELLAKNTPNHLAKTILPCKVNDGFTVTNLLAFVYRQMKQWLRPDTDTGKLFLTSESGYFLPPNCLLEELEIYSIRLDTV